LNPASPQHYLTYAGLAFTAGRESDATAMLRRSIVVAPRNNEARIRLAEYYANQFRTLDALDLLWSAFDVDESPAARRSMIRTMIPLYNRRSEIPKLINKLRGQNRKQVSNDQVESWVAEVWITIGDGEQAIEVIKRAAAANPRSELLLQRLLEYAINTNRLSEAVEYATAIVKISDTPANRDRLRSVQVKAGIIDEREAKLQKLAEISNPAEMGAFIMMHARHEPVLGAQLCEQALINDPSLWDIRVLRAQFLLSHFFLAPTKILEQADRLASEVCDLDIPPETQSPSLLQLPRPTPPKETKPKAAAERSASDPFAIRQGLYQLPRRNTNFLTAIQNALTDPQDQFALKAASHVKGLAQNATRQRYQAIQSSSTRRSNPIGP
ncbi:MAG: hypothetical protein AAFN70_18725, partial [Planctomycetota bacterium]